MEGAADWAALGACIAEKAENRIMAVLNLPKKMGPTATKQIISCCSPGMNDPMLHLMGYTPESPTLEAAFKGKMPKNPERFTVTMDDHRRDVPPYQQHRAGARPGKGETGGHRHLRLSGRDL